MNRRGFALLAVLWVIAAVASAVGAGLAAERLGQRTTRNRVVLARGRWAAEACLAVAQARWGTPRARVADTVNLGRTTRCTWRFEDPGARPNVNLVARDVLERLFEEPGLRRDSAERLVQEVVALRASAHFTSVAELLSIPGFPPSALPLLTTDGPGTVNVNAAPAAVLAALPGFSREAIDVVASRRAAGRPVTSLDALLGALSPIGRAAVLQAYADLAGLVTFAPTQLLLSADGWVAAYGDVPRATIELLVVPLPERLATVRRRMW
ncbi:MAG: hypothetical protein AAB409_09530 [Gemmatimonadota bacterium]|mgnify:CR=1 FL=1